MQDTLSKQLSCVAGLLPAFQRNIKMVCIMIKKNGVYYNSIIVFSTKNISD